MAPTKVTTAVRAARRDPAGGVVHIPCSFFQCDATPADSRSGAPDDSRTIIEPSTTAAHFAASRSLLSANGSPAGWGFAAGRRMAPLAAGGALLAAFPCGRPGPLICFFFPGYAS